MQEMKYLCIPVSCITIDGVHVRSNVMSTWSFSTASPRSGTDGYRSPFPHRRFHRGDVARHVYVCTHVARLFGPARKNWSAFYNGTWFTWFDETITATCTASIDNVVSLRCHGDTASSTEENFPWRFFRSYNSGEKWRISCSYHGRMCTASECKPTRLQK